MTNIVKTTKNNQKMSGFSCRNGMLVFYI